MKQRRSEFWVSKTLEQHIQEQQSVVFTSIAYRKQSFWPEEESMDDFLVYLQKERQEDLLGRR